MEDVAIDEALTVFCEHVLNMTRSDAQGVVEGMDKAAKYKIAVITKQTIDIATGAYWGAY